MQTFPQLTPAPLIESVFLEYARYLHGLGFTRGMRYYCGLSGDSGEQLLAHLRSIGHEKSPLTFEVEGVS